MSCFLRNRGTVARDTCDCMGLDVNWYGATERKTDHSGKVVTGNTPTDSQRHVAAPGVQLKS